MGFGDTTKTIPPTAAAAVTTVDKPKALLLHSVCFDSSQENTQNVANDGKCNPASLPAPQSLADAAAAGTTTEPKQKKSLNGNGSYDSKANDDTHVVHKSADYGLAEATDLVKSILDQITLHDSPPINDELNNDGNGSSFMTSTTAEPTTWLSKNHQINSSKQKMNHPLKMTTKTKTTRMMNHLKPKKSARQQQILVAQTQPQLSLSQKYPDYSYSTSMVPKKMGTNLPSDRNDRAERKMGNAALATLCRRTVETIQNSGITAKNTSNNSDRDQQPQLIKRPMHLTVDTQRNDYRDRPPRRQNQPPPTTPTPASRLQSPSKDTKKYFGMSAHRRHLSPLKDPTPRNNNQRDSDPPGSTRTTSYFSYAERNTNLHQMPTPRDSAAATTTANAGAIPHYRHDYHHNQDWSPQTSEDTSDDEKETGWKTAAQKKRDPSPSVGTEVKRLSSSAPYSLEDSSPTCAFSSSSSSLEEEDAMERKVGESLFDEIQHHLFEPANKYSSQATAGGKDKGDEDSATSTLRFQMFGSEYARFLSQTPLAPEHSSLHKANEFTALSNKAPRRAGGGGRQKAQGFQQMASSPMGRAPNLEDADEGILTGAITDIVATHGETQPPKGYYRISKTPHGHGFSSIQKQAGRSSGGVQVHINVKKEANWDRAAQRPCVTALAVIFPDRKEFVPPGFSVVRTYEEQRREQQQQQQQQQQHGSDKAIVFTTSKGAANLNYGTSGERVFLCYRRSREGNPITGLLPLLPWKRDVIPVGYTVLERTPRNFVADLNSKSGTPVFLAFRQRLANLETLRPLPLLFSVYNEAMESTNAKPNSESNSSTSTGSSTTGTSASTITTTSADADQELEEQKVYHNSHQKGGKLKAIFGGTRLHAYYCTGGTIVSSNVGKFHIMDRSTHALVSPSSISNRLALIQAAREKDTNSGGVGTDGNSSAGSSAHHNYPQPHLYSISKKGNSLDADDATGSITNSLTLSVSNSWSLDTPLTAEGSNFSSRWSTHPNNPSTPKQGAPGSTTTKTDNLFTANDGALRLCVRTLAFIPAVEPANKVLDSQLMQARVAILTPVLTACYTQHGGSAMLAVEGLTKLIQETDFFRSDVPAYGNSAAGSESRITLLDITIQTVCDIATSTARETSFGPCIDFVSAAVSYSNGCLNTRTIGYIIRFYLFMFYFGASISTTSKAPNTVWSSFENFGAGRRSVVSSDDVPFLFESARGRRHLSGGAPQLAALGLKHLATLLVKRMTSSIPPDDRGTGFESEEIADDAADNGVKVFVQNLVSSLVDKSVRRVDLANYTQLALHQIYRSGGSELFWYDMLTNCGSGLFGGIQNMNDGQKGAFMIGFAFLANIVKVSNGRIRKEPTAGELVPRDVASKLLTLELLTHFLVVFGESCPSPKDQQRHHESVEVVLFSVRRLVVPCVLSNTVQSLQDDRIFRRVLQILTELWTRPIFRRAMKTELGVLIDHFALRLLQLGPQFKPLHPHGGHPDEINKDNQTANLFHRPLVNQQIDLMFAIEKWFDPTTTDFVEFFLNFDTDISCHFDGSSSMIPGTQWKLCEQLCMSICSVAKQTGDFLCDQVSQSKSFNDLPVTPTGKQSSKHSSRLTESENVLSLRRSARQLQAASFSAGTKLAKCIASSAAKTAYNKSFVKELMTQQQTTKVGVRTEKIVPSESSGCDSSEEGWISPNGQPDGSIVAYWQTAIAAAERKKTSQDQVPAVNDSGSTSRAYDWENNSSNTQGTANEILQQAFDIVENKSLKKAIDYLVDCNFLSPSPREIATFLRIHHGRLDATILGDYLGEGGINSEDIEYWNLVRFNYVRAISFVAMTVEQGLRHFLTNCGFRLPGEAQRIDRIMTTFSQCYWEDNAGDHLRCPFDDQDTVFLLSFAIIMLNTDLHKAPTRHGRSRKQRKRMSKEEFLNNLRGVASSDQLSRDYLSSVYDSVEADPIELFEDSRPPIRINTKSSRRAGPHGDGIDRLDPTKELRLMVSNVNKSEELLRGLSVHEFRNFTTDDFSKSMDYGQRDGLFDLCTSALSCCWNHFHDLIFFSVENAQHDPQALVLAVALLRHCLVATVCLDMTPERTAFITLLARFKMIADRKKVPTNSLSFTLEQWFVDLHSVLSNPDKTVALEHVQEFMEGLEETLETAATSKKQMVKVAKRIRDGHIMMHDPSRFFIKEGDLVKKSTRFGKSSTYRFFLFSDLLVYAKQSLSGDFKVHEELSLHVLKIVDWFPNKQQMKTSFAVHHPRKTFLVVCKDEKERTEWLRAIRTASEDSEAKLAAIVARKNNSEHTNSTRQHR